MNNNNLSIISKLEKILNNLINRIDERKKEVLSLEQKINEFKNLLSKLEKSLNFWASLNIEEKQKLLEDLSVKLEELEEYISVSVQSKINEILKKIKENKEETNEKIKELEDKIEEKLKELKYKVEAQYFVPVGSRSYVDVLWNNSKIGTSDKLNFKGLSVKDISYDQINKTMNLEFGFIETATFVLGRGQNLSVGTNKTNALIVPRKGIIIKALAYLKQPPEGSDVIFDINLNGTSIWNINQNNRLRVLAGQNSGSQTNFDIIDVNEGDILTIDVDQVGSTFPGQDATVELLMFLTE